VLGADLQPFGVWCHALSINSCLSYCPLDPYIYTDREAIKIFNMDDLGTSWYISISDWHALPLIWTTRRIAYCDSIALKAFQLENGQA